MYTSGSLMFCGNCRRVIGYIDYDKICVLKDVRLLYFVPIDARVIVDKQIMLFRVLEHGPVKRKLAAVDLCDGPPCKKFKFDNTRSVIVMRVRVEEDESLIVQNEDDRPAFIRPLNLPDLIYDPTDEVGFLSDTDMLDLELDDYESSIGFESEPEDELDVGDSVTFIEFYDDLVTLHSMNDAVTQVFWVSSPFPDFEGQGDYRILDVSMSSRECSFVVGFFFLS